MDVLKFVVLKGELVLLEFCDCTVIIFTRCL
jgi:hypothetical protein